MDAEMRGYCGYRCEICPARTGDRDERAKLVEGWQKLYGHTMYTPDNVVCVGCPNQGDVADTQCQARPCVRAKGFASCGQCPDFPCAKLKNILSPLFFMEADTYHRCMAQFDITEEVAKTMAQAGTLPPWLAAVFRRKRDLLNSFDLG